ncbi:MAG TPA: DUF1648 domain-containing protein [Pyrinomonadaceae bacterium]|jgi:uncharacterized membrane protein
MQTALPQSTRLSDYTNIAVEIFVAAFTILPFFVLAYFYTMLPERVPLFMNLNGEVAIWGEKSWLSVFRVALMATVTQVVCLLMKYTVLQAAVALPVDNADDYARLYKQSTVLSTSLWDWFRCIAALKMSAATLDTIFLSIEQFKSLSKPAFIITFIVALLSLPIALFYGYRLFILKRKIKERFGDAKTRKPVDVRYVYGGVLYFNPNDSALFVGKYVFNFANVRAWVFIACIIAYPLLVFLPA